MLSSLFQLVHNATYRCSVSSLIVKQILTIATPPHHSLFILGWKYIQVILIQQFLAQLSEADTIHET